MYEYGTYGMRVQDPNDPNYEYNKRETYEDISDSLGESLCTYDDVKMFIQRKASKYNASAYNLVFNNCQDFARELGQYLVDDCE